MLPSQLLANRLIESRPELFEEIKITWSPATRSDLAGLAVRRVAASTIPVAGYVRRQAGGGMVRVKRHSRSVAGRVRGPQMAARQARNTAERWNFAANQARYGIPPLGVRPLSRNRADLAAGIRDVMRWEAEEARRYAERAKLRKRAARAARSAYRNRPSEREAAYRIATQIADAPLLDTGDTRAQGESPNVRALRSGSAELARLEAIQPMVRRPKRVSERSVRRAVRGAWSRTDDPRSNDTLERYRDSALFAAETEPRSAYAPRPTRRRRRRQLRWDAEWR